MPVTFKKPGSEYSATIFNDFCSEGAACIRKNRFACTERFSILNFSFLIFRYLCFHGENRNLPGLVRPVHTRSHAALVDDALKLFDRIVIGIGNNTAKQGLLTVENRKRLIDDIYAADPRVEARVYTGLTGEFAEAVGACAIIRGVRNTTDFEYERTMEATNHRIYPALTTVMLFTPSAVADISSSTVREVLAFGRSVEEFLPDGIDITNYL